MKKEPSDAVSVAGPARDPDEILPEYHPALLRAGARD